MLNDPYTYSENIPPGTLKAVVSGMEEAFGLYEKLAIPWIVV